MAETGDLSLATIAVTGQITSTLATGTAPLSVASTTVVTNLNADLIDGVHASTFAPASHHADHENGGGDEISIAGLSGQAADDQNPTAHHGDHENGGGDEISVAGLSGALADAQTPAAHGLGSAYHSDGDEIVVGTGLLAYPATPGNLAAHNLVYHAEGGLIKDTCDLLTAANVKGLWILDQAGAVTAITDRGPNAHGVTLSANASTLTPRIAGLAPSLLFESGAYWSAADSDDFSFGDGSTDSAFSVVVLMWPSSVTTQYFLCKYDSTGGAAAQREWQMYFNVDGKLTFLMTDDSTLGYRGRRYNTGLAADIGGLHCYIGTYDGTSACAGVKLYRDGVQIDDIDVTSGAYTAMENLTAAVGSFMINAAGTRLPASARYALTGICAGELTARAVQLLDWRLRSWAGAAT